MTTVIFTASSSLFSKAIRWFTKGRVSHVQIGTKYLCVPITLEAVIGGVQLLQRNRAIGSDTIIAEFEITKPVDDHIIRALARLGDNYGYAELLGNAIARIARWFGVKMRNPLRSAKTLVCTEFVCEVFRHDFEAWKGLDPTMVSPEELLEACEKSSEFKRLPSVQV